MHKLLGFLAFLTFLLHDPVNGENNANATKEALEIPPVVARVLVNNLEDVERDEKDEKLDEKVQVKCQHTDYRSYVQCLLQESKREKRQGYQQQCSGVGCTQSCPGNGCLPANQQQQQCIGTGCLQVGQQQCVGTGCVQTVQQPCSGTGCLFFGYNCGGTGCRQIGQNCYGVGCVPPSCAGSSCNARPEPRPEIGIKTVDDEFWKEIGNIKQDLGYMKAQNERLIKEAEKTTSFILRLVNKPEQKPTIVHEPFPVGHNLTTNIDINNYMTNQNVVKVPEVKNPVEKENKTHCCTVVRQKTCRKTSRPPYFGCGHKKHRTCGTVCSGKRVIYSHVKPGCNGDHEENCVSYHPHPYNPTSYTGYPTSGYYPPMPMYYPMYAPPPMMIYGPPQMPMYTPPCGCEDCDDCEVEVEAEDCEDTDADCELAAKRDGGDHTGVRSYRNVHLDEILEVEKEAQAIKRSEDELTASIDMLEKAVELKKLDEKQKEQEKSLKNDETIGVSQEPPTLSPES